jgi:endopeptidase La
MELKILKKNEIIKCNILQKEYKILSTIITKLQNVIMMNENILIFSKNSCMKNLNEMIKKLNESYNQSIINIFSVNKNSKNILEDKSDNNIKKEITLGCKNDSLYSDIPEIKSDESKNSIDDNNSLSDDMDISEVSEEKKLKINKPKKNNVNKKIEYIDNFNLTNYNLEIIDEVKKLINESIMLNDLGDLNELITLAKYNPLKNIKEQILLLGKIVGFTSVKDIIFLLYNVNNIHLENENIEKFKLINEILCPLNYEIINNENIKNENIKNEILSINKIHNSNYITLFNNQCEIKIAINNTLLTISGYILPDPLNIFIRTSQISNNFLYKKKILFENIVNLISTEFNNKCIISKENFKKIQHINKDFADIYLKNMTIIEILIINEEQFINNMIEDYYKFIELNKLQFVKLLKNFTKDSQDNIYNMFNTIKLLLLGSDDNCSVASLLFNLLKDKKSKSNNCIANIIYNQLNYIAQLKLKKSSFNIKNELEKIKDITSADIDLKKQVILSKNMPNHIKKICLEKIEELKNSSNETYKIKMYVSLLVQFPWPSDIDDNFFKILSTDKTKSKEFLEKTEKNLDIMIYGHKEAKNKTLQMLGKIISVQGCNIHPIGLVGPPGVGKTKYAQILAKCLDIPFVQITLGGQNDGELLHGHGYTYSGAQPGLIVKKMVDAASSRCIMFFDELDKCVSKNGQVNELMSILIHLTDPMTNGSFQDRFFQEITFPLNKVIFIFSFNDINKIDKILLDRMEILTVESYNLKEKISIANDHLLKDICKDVGFQPNSVIFNKEILSKIIEEHTFEPGVRSLKRCIENILLKLNLDRIYQKNLFEPVNDIIKEYSDLNPLVINENILEEYLGKSKITFKTIHKKDIIGIVNGLYATNMSSGGIVPIQITGHHFGNANKFILKLTGNQKKIMRESILYSFTTAINLINLKQKEIFFNKYPGGLHIHNPEAATPKDGPSAGVAFTLAFLSVMLDKKIKHNIALTGEIDLYGNVTKIGGVRYKVQGAFKANVNTVYLPKENEEDVDKLKKELPEIFDNLHECKFIETVIDVARDAIVDWDESVLIPNIN